jgi:hypothetical protein
VKVSCSKTSRAALMEKITTTIMVKVVAKITGKNINIRY